MNNHGGIIDLLRPHFYDENFVTNAELRVTQYYLSTSVPCWGIDGITTTNDFIWKKLIHSINKLKCSISVVLINQYLVLFNKNCHHWSFVIKKTTYMQIIGTVIEHVLL